MLLERDDELRLIDAAVEATTALRGAAILIEGPPGVGKSTLLDESAKRATDRGVQVLRATGDDLESDLPWGIVRQLFAAHLRERPGAPPVEQHLFVGAAALCRPLFSDLSATTTDLADPFPLVHGLHWLTVALAERQPLLLVVDDAQWADPLSLRFINYLINRLDGIAASVLLARRPSDPGRSPSGPVLDRLAGNDSLEVVTVQALSSTSIRSLAHKDLPTADEAFCEALTSAVAGNPFLYREMVTEIRAENLEPTAVNVPNLARLQPRGVRDAILLRLDRLGEHATAIARTVAVLGGAATLPRLRSVLQLNAEDAIESIDALVDATLLSTEPDLAFAHPIVREVVYASIGPARRAQLHFDVAAALYDDGAPPIEVASHLLVGHPARHPWATEVLRAAATTARSRGAPDRAAAYLRAALDPHRDDETTATILLELGRAEAAAGEDTALDRFRDALRSVPSGAAHVSTALELGEAMFAAGRFGEAAAAFERALDMIEDHASDPLDELVEAKLVAGLDTASLLSGDRSARAFARIAPLVEKPPATPTAAERVLLASAAGASALGHDLTRERLVRLTDLVIGEFPGEDVLTRVMLEPVPFALMMCDEFERARALLDGAVAEARRRGEAATYASLLPFRAYAALGQGRLVDAIGDCTDALRIAEESPTASRQSLASVRYVLARASLARGDLADAMRAVDVPDAEERWGTTPLYGWFLDGVGRVELARNHPERALRAFWDAAARFGRAGGVGAFCDWRTGAAAALHALDRREEGLALAVEEYDLAVAFGAPRAVSIALRGRARLAGDAGTSIDLLQEAVSVLESSEAELDRARAELEFGAALRRSGRRRDARAPLRAGLERACRCGAHPLVERARSELEASGARRPALAISGIEALTPSERRVCSLAVDGLNNREIAQALFVTRKTVESHLSSAYRKLEITSRTQLPAALGT